MYSKIKPYFQKRNKVILASNSDFGNRYWILRTKEDNNGHRSPMWDHFRDESVIAIGWDIPELKWLDKAKISEALEYDLDRGDKYIAKATKTIDTFLHQMKVNDNVALCDGYNSTQPNVKIYGFAKINSVPRYDSISTWWKIKRNVTINVVEKQGMLIPRERLATILKKGSCIGTVTEIDEVRYSNLKRYLGL